MGKKVERINKISVGDVYPVKGGTITIIEKKSRYEILVKHNDEHGHEMWTRQDAVEKGMVKNPFYRDVQGVGYMGAGEYVASKDYKVTEEYRRWCGMMQRGYNQNTKKKHPTYEDCTVCKEWHNFQNFAEWYTNQFGYRKGFHLDKDILVEGNKTYSPETCCLVPISLNSFFSGNKKIDEEIPTGVSKNPSGSFTARIYINGKKKTLGTFKDIDMASNSYRAARKTWASELAERFKKDIDPKTYLAIINREF